MIDTVFKYITGIVKLRGGTDATPIGNSGDKLRVDGSGVVQPIILPNAIQIPGNILAMAAGSEQTVVSYAVGVGTEFRLSKAHASADGDTIFRLKKNGNTLAVRYNNWCERNVSFDYGSLLFQSGDIITITAIHTCLNTLNVSAEIYGY